LIQFVSNLCYGTGKFRKMLASTDNSEFIKTIRQILDSVTKTANQRSGKDKLAKQDDADRALLHQAVLSFIGNLCCDQQLRKFIAANNGELLSKIA